MILDDAFYPNLEQTREKNVFFLATGYKNVIPDMAIIDVHLTLSQWGKHASTVKRPTIKPSTVKKGNFLQSTVKNAD